MYFIFFDSEKKMQKLDDNYSLQIERELDWQSLGIMDILNINGLSHSAACPYFYNASHSGKGLKAINLKEVK